MQAASVTTTSTRCTQQLPSASRATATSCCDVASRMRLEEHGFIVKQNGVWRLRVPLFESWLRQYRDAYPLAG